jgi:hypothetical protein
MANLIDVKASKDVSVTLCDGTKHKLVYTLGALAKLEEEYGSVDKAFEALDKNSMNAVITVLWAGMLHEDRNLSKDDVAFNIDIAGLSDIMESVNTALTQDMPDASDIKAEAEAASVDAPNV